MPLYEYDCVGCLRRFSELRSTSEMDQEIDCPECGSRKTERFFSSFSVGKGVTGKSQSSSQSSSQFR